MTIEKEEEKPFHIHLYNPDEKLPEFGWDEHFYHKTSEEEREQMIKECEECEKENKRVWDQWECVPGCHKVPNPNGLFGDFDCVCDKPGIDEPLERKDDELIEEDEWNGSLYGLGKDWEIYNEVTEDYVEMIKKCEKCRKENKLGCDKPGIDEPSVG